MSYNDLLNFSCDPKYVLTFDIVLKCVGWRDSSVVNNWSTGMKMWVEIPDMCLAMVVLAFNLNVDGNERAAKKFDL